MIAIFFFFSACNLPAFEHCLTFFDRSSPTPLFVILFVAFVRFSYGDGRCYCRQETAELILPHDLKKSMQFAGRHISFEQEEVAEMKSFGEPGESGVASSVWV